MIVVSGRFPKQSVCCAKKPPYTFAKGRNGLSCGSAWEKEHICSAKKRGRSLEWSAFCRRASFLHQVENDARAVSGEN